MQKDLIELSEIFLEKPVFEKEDGNYIDVLAAITKQCNNEIHSSTKLTPTKSSSKKNEGYVYKSFLDKRKKVKPKFQVNDLVRTADLKKTFSKCDTTNWSYNLYKITEYRVIALTIYQKDITKAYWKRQNYHWEKTRIWWQP